MRKPFLFVAVLSIVFPASAARAEDHTKPIDKSRDHSTKPADKKIDPKQIESLIRRFDENGDGSFDNAERQSIQHAIKELQGNPEHAKKLLKQMEAMKNQVPGTESKNGKFGKKPLGTKEVGKNPAMSKPSKKPGSKKQTKPLPDSDENDFVSSEKRSGGSGLHMPPAVKKFAAGADKQHAAKSKNRVEKNPGAPGSKSNSMNHPTRSPSGKQASFPGKPSKSGKPAK